MKLTNNQEKMDIVSRLVKEGKIDFAEAIELLKEEEIGFIPVLPTNPPNPLMPPWEITCSTVTYDIKNMPYRSFTVLN